MGLLYSNYESQNNTTNNLKINAVSGTLTKTYPKSYFINENKLYELYSNEPYRKVKLKETRNYYDRPEKYDSYEGNEYKTYYKHIPIIILQIMLAGENQKIYEVIDKEDYDKMFGVERVDKE